MWWNVDFGAATTGRPNAKTGQVMTSNLNHRGFLIASWIVLAVVAAGAAYLAFQARWFDALAMAGFVLLGVTFISTGDRLPRVFTFLFVVAALANTAGYVFDLWHGPVWFDEAVHAYTSFAGMAAIGWLLVRRTRLEESAHAWRLVLAVIAIGLVIGIAWEIFEWAIGIIGPWLDTRRDLVMDALGAVAAGLWCAWVAGRLKRPDHG